MVLMTGDSAKFEIQRQPKKRHRIAGAYACLIAGVIFFLTILLWFVGVILWFSGVALFISSRFVKTEKVECPHCKTPNTIETHVHHFNCSQCNTTIRREGASFVIPD